VAAPINNSVFYLIISVLLHSATVRSVETHSLSLYNTLYDYALHNH